MNHACPDLSGLADRLERHRDHHFRRIPIRRVKDESEALAFIEEVGFCSAFTPGMDVPCLREAIEGRREPALPEHIQHDRAIMMTWRLKDDLAARREVYYGKVIAGRPGFVALAMLPAFLRLRVPSVSYKKLYERGLLSHCGKLVMDALSHRGASETKALKLSSGYAQAKMRAEFDRAMKELQEKFLALKVEERYGPFTYVWDIVERRWAEARREARSLSTRDAASQLVRRYYEIAGYGNERAVARILGIEAGLIEAAAKQMQRSGLLRRGQRVNGLRETVAILEACI